MKINLINMWNIIQIIEIIYDNGNIRDLFAIDDILSDYGVSHNDFESIEPNPNLQKDFLNFLDKRKIGVITISMGNKIAYMNGDTTTLDAFILKHQNRAVDNINKDTIRERLRGLKKSEDIEDYVSLIQRVGFEIKAIKDDIVLTSPLDKNQFSWYNIL